MSLKNLFSFVFSPSYRFSFNASCGFYKKMDDKKYLEKMYKSFFHNELNLESPKTFNEKTQWLKLYNRNESYIKMADKYESKELINDTLKGNYSVPTLGLYKTFDEIDFSKLPERFVIKTTHDSGSFAIVKDKSKADFKSIKKTINSSLKRNYFYYQREWPYKFLEPRIIIEELLEHPDYERCPEYKLFCFNGNVKLFLVCLGSAHGSGRSNDFFDENFEHIPVDTVYKQLKDDRIEKPSYLNKMIEVSEKLSKNIPFLRVDFYCMPDRFYIGELTFYHNSGLCRFNPSKYDRIFGDLLTLPLKAE